MMRIDEICELCAKSNPGKILQNAEQHFSIEIERCEDIRSIETVEASQEAKTCYGPELLRNESNRPRYILVLRFWHPGLTEAGTGFSGTLDKLCKFQNLLRHTLTQT